MKKWTIRSRLILSFFILITTTVAFIGSYILWYFHHHNIDMLTANLFTDAQIISQLINDDMIIAKTDIDAKIKDIGKTTELRITIIDNTGTVLGDSWENPAIMENHLNRPEVASALQDIPDANIRFSETTGQNFLYAAIPIKPHGEILGTVRVASTLVHVENSYNEMKSVILTALALTILLSIFLSLKLAHKYTSPIEAITAVAQEIGNGKLDKRVHIKTGDEIELLAHTLNSLAFNLDNKISEIIAEKSKLELILKNMDNAVILLDQYGRITSANKSAIDIFAITPNMLGKHNLQVIASNKLERAINETISSKTSRSINLKINIHNNKRSFQVFIAPIVTAEKNITNILSVFHDITALQEMQERQSDFIANASHELATPLTAIKGFAETLLDGALGDAALSHKFVNIIHLEAQRMQRLVNDLLKLAKLNSEEYRKHVLFESINIAPVLNNVVQELSSRIKSKQLNVSINADDNIFINANLDYIKQVLLNLLDNSIKYTAENGNIYIESCQSNHSAILSITDTGIGIPPQDIPLIFDRFYRVDRARSRKEGGTGLGLAIVKFIIELHGGNITVNSQVNVGTSFTITLPLT